VVRSTRCAPATSSSSARPSRARSGDTAEITLDTSNIQHYLIGAQGALLVDAAGNPCSGCYVYNSGNLIAGWWYRCVGAAIVVGVAGDDILGQEQFWEAMDILTPEPSIHVNGEKAIEVACRQCEHHASAGKNEVDIGVRPPVGRRHCGYRNSPCRVMMSVTPRWSTPPLSYATGRSAARCESSPPALRALEAEGW